MLSENIINLIYKMLDYKKIFSKGSSLAVIAVFWLAGVFIALFAPSHSHSTDSFLGGYIRFMLAILMPRGGGASLHPFAFEFYYSFVWWSLPFWFSLWIGWLKKKIGILKSGLIFKPVLSIGNRFALLIMIPLWLALLYFCTLSDGQDVRIFKIGTSRIQLALFGISVPALAGGLLALIVQSFRRIFWRN